MTQVEGLIYINETLNMDMLFFHSKTWVQDVQGLRSTALDGKIMSYTYLPRLTRFTYLNTALTTALTAPEEPGRQKRNIIGSLLSSFTGLATEDEITRVVAMDKDMREKVVDLMRLTTTYEEDVTRHLGNLSVEQERVATVLNTLSVRVSDLSNLLARVAVHSYLMDSDLDQLEKLLVAIRVGEASDAHSLQLAVGAGLPPLTHFILDSWSYTLSPTRMLTLVFRTYTFRQVPVMHLSVLPDRQVLRTEERTFLLHPGLSASGALLTGEEVRLTGIECDTCAFLVHLSGETYRVLQNGSLTCFDQWGVPLELNLTAGALQDIPGPQNCSNLAVSVGAARLRLNTVYLIGNARKGDDDFDELKELLNDGHTAMDVEAMKKRAIQMDARLRFDREMVANRVDDFVRSTTENMNSVTAGIFLLLPVLPVCFVVLPCCLFLVNYRRSLPIL